MEKHAYNFEDEGYVKQKEFWGSDHVTNEDLLLDKIVIQPELNLDRVPQLDDISRDKLLDHKIYPLTEKESFIVDTTFKGVNPTPKEALRYNEGKLRYDLIDPFAIAELAKVYTKGAAKYADHNWKKGMKWSKMLASMKRHIAAFEMGEDIDPETECAHMAQAAWNALGLVTYARIHPEMDDRQHSYLETKRIGLDIDEVLANFVDAYSRATGIEGKPDHWNFCYNMMDNFEKWKNNTTSKFKEGDKLINELDDFYEYGIKPLCNPNLPFEPICYITNRPVETHITKSWLEKHKFPLKPIFTTKSREEKIAIALEQKLDYFIDDNFETFVEMNKAGICCFLMDGSHNQKYNVGYKRIKSLEDFKNRFL